MADTDELGAKLKDLLVQATTERSHYYVAACINETLAELHRLTDAMAEAKRDANTLQKGFDDLTNDVEVAIATARSEGAADMQRRCAEATDTYRRNWDRAWRDDFTAHILALPLIETKEMK